MNETAWREHDLYAVLNISPDADPSGIARAYRREARASHPDLNPDADGERFRLVQLAYDTLGEPSRRYRYDIARVTGSAVEAEVDPADHWFRPTARVSYTAGYSAISHYSGRTVWSTSSTSSTAAPTNWASLWFNPWAAWLSRPA